MENDKIIFRTPEIPKNRRRKSLPYCKIDNDQSATGSPLSSLSSSYSFSYGSGSSLNSSANESTSMYDTSLNSSIDDYLEIENITRSLDLTTLTFDDEKRQKVSPRFAVSYATKINLLAKTKRIALQRNVRPKCSIDKACLWSTSGWFLISYE